MDYVAFLIVLCALIVFYFVQFNRPGKVNDDNINEYLDKIRAEDEWFDIYNENRLMILSCWRDLRTEEGWTHKNRDKLWRLGIEGRGHFIRAALTGLIEPSRYGSVACFQHPIMLLKKEKRYGHGISILEEAIKWGIKDQSWYQKNLELFKSKIK